ncbi:hypothetical protein ACFVMC_29400 [Nocardia sp. NPDC127579]|uniref:hypothetical protein n=1 Tax=Nocardia sp. NPDC127579 TaxID=3345402 RepID=UPI003637645A
MLDMDEPAEVVAGSTRFAAAITTVTGQVAATTNDLVPQENPASELDRDLCGVLDWIRATFAAAVTAVDDRAAVVVFATSETVGALASADVDSAANLGRYDTI